MSFKAMAWASEQTPPTATAKLALLMMASMADNETYACWPSYQHLADLCMVSRRTMATTIKTLSDNGFISIKNRSNSKGQATSLYTINVVSVSANIAEVSANDDTVSANPAPGVSAKVAHGNSHSIKLSTKQSEKQCKAEFATWYSRYPKKKSRAAAEKAWLKIKPDLDTLISALDDQLSNDPDWQGDTQFLPHPATYLNNERWTDEPDRPIPVETDLERTLRLGNEYLRDVAGNGEDVGRDVPALCSDMEEPEWRH